MIHKDFDIFRSEAFWPIHKASKDEITEGEVRLNDDFKSTFPILSKLMSEARILNIKTTTKKETFYYRLYSWTNSENLICGWLCLIEQANHGINIVSEHSLLLENIGGIQESYSQFDFEDEVLTDNQSFLFIKSQCHSGIGEWATYYRQSCEDENMNQIDTNNMICFVCEANGNETYYRIDTKEVLLFAPDHCFENIEILQNQPDYTFYKMTDIKYFKDYVETLANQWLENIN